MCCVCLQIMAWMSSFIKVVVLGGGLAEVVVDYVDGVEVVREDV